MKRIICCDVTKGTCKLFLLFGGGLEVALEEEEEEEEEEYYWWWCKMMANLGSKDEWARSTPRLPEI